MAECGIGVGDFVSGRQSAVIRRCDYTLRVLQKAIVVSDRQQTTHNPKKELTPANSDEYNEFVKKASCFLLWKEQ